MEKQLLERLKAFTILNNPTNEVHFENIDEKVQDILGLLDWRIREYPEFQDLFKNVNKEKNNFG